MAGSRNSPLQPEKERSGDCVGWPAIARHGAACNAIPASRRLIWQGWLRRLNAAGGKVKFRNRQIWYFFYDDLLFFLAFPRIPPASVLARIDSA